MLALGVRKNSKRHEKMTTTRGNKINFLELKIAGLNARLIDSYGEEGGIAQLLGPSDP
jgi:hypothetical protein